MPASAHAPRHTAAASAHRPDVHARAGAVPLPHSQIHSAHDAPASHAGAGVNVTQPLDSTSTHTKRTTPSYLAATFSGAFVLA